ncbi:hypothetical protein [Tenacibaculum sp. TC6]|uniref:hypothetical protein n=1 Tax=Tenacibaculum sp. TC6 TaxID=3423223 RepID=UPI003D364DF4
MKDMLKAMRKVPSVNKLICLLISLIFVNCGINKIPQQQKSEYSLEKFKSLNSLDSWVTIKTYDKEIFQNTIPASIQINNLIFSEKKVFNVKAGKFDISVDFFNKVGLKIEKLKVEEGDSIIIKAHLRDYKGPTY